MIEPDNLLLEGLRRGDDTAFDCLFLRYYEQVYRVAYRLMQRREEAEDLAQETFIELYSRPPRLDETGTLLAWLCRVALNRGYNALRGQKRERERAERWAVVPEQVDPSALLMRTEAREEVREALRELPERQSKLLLLRHAGLSYGEVASILEIAPGSVGTLLVRAERAFLAAYKSSETEMRERQEPKESMEGIRS